MPTHHDRRWCKISLLLYILRNLKSLAQIKSNTILGTFSKLLVRISRNNILLPPIPPKAFKMFFYIYKISRHHHRNKFSYEKVLKLEISSPSPLLLSITPPLAPMERWNSSLPPICHQKSKRPTERMCNTKYYSYSGYYWSLVFPLLHFVVFGTTNK